MPQKLNISEALIKKMNLDLIFHFDNFSWVKVSISDR